LGVAAAWANHRDRIFIAVKFRAAGRAGARGQIVGFQIFPQRAVALGDRSRALERSIIPGGAVKRIVVYGDIDAGCLRVPAGRGDTIECVVIPNARPNAALMFRKILAFKHRSAVNAPHLLHGTVELNWAGAVGAFVFVYYQHSRSLF
jgi:hypothetical protein